MWYCLICHVGGYRKDPWCPEVQMDGVKTVDRFVTASAVIYRVTDNRSETPLIALQLNSH